VFRNNRNKQKTNRNRSKFGKISTFLIPHTISSVCFSCFYTGPKHQNRRKKKILGFAKNNRKITKKQPKLSFGLFQFEPRKNLLFREPPYRECFLEIFWFVSVCFGLFRQSSVCFGCFDTDPKHRSKPKKVIFGFAKQTKKQPKQIGFQFVSV
jgi:hypothetical protein